MSLAVVDGATQRNMDGTDPAWPIVFPERITVRFADVPRTLFASVGQVLRSGCFANSPQRLRTLTCPVRDTQALDGRITNSRLRVRMHDLFASAAFRFA